MLNSSVLDVAIGLIFIYLVLSLICTSINEAIAQFLGLRADVLYRAIRGMFEGPDATAFTWEIFDHFLVRSLREKGSVSDRRGMPSYIPAPIFSRVVTELIGLPEPAGKALNPTDEAFATAVSASHPKYDEGVIAPLRPLINAANNKLDQSRENIEKWYDDAMQRATGWYKRRTQIITFLVALAAATTVNADSLMILNRLWASPAQRTQIEAAAKNLSAKAPTQKPGEPEKPAPNADLLDKATREAALGLVGWRPRDEKTDPRHFPSSADDWSLKLLGLIITAFAASLGAPFWFDVLGKVMNIRSAGTSPSERPTKDGKPANVKNRIPSSDGAAADTSSKGPQAEQGGQ